MSENKKKDLEEEVVEEVKEEIEEETAKEPSEEDKIAGLQKLLEESQDKYLRLAAEYDNFRKRTTKEKENIYEDAKVATLKSILDIYDNLERGITQFEEGDPHRQGMELIAKQFMDALSKQGVTEIEALNQPFDPEKHEAVMRADVEDAEENTIVEVFQKGFALGDKVLRYPKVKVAN